MSFTYKFIFMQIKVVIKKNCMKTRFETETRSNSEMIYLENTEMVQDEKELERDKGTVRTISRICAY